MIPAHPSTKYVASYEQPSVTGDGKGIRFQLPVVAWSDDGEALVAQAGKLVPAADVDGCLGFQMLPTVEPGATVPGGGWRCEVTEEDGTVWSAPVIAWTIREGGWGVPVVTNAHGHAMYPKNLERPFLIYHPESETVVGDKADEPALPVMQEQTITALRNYDWLIRNTPDALEEVGLHLESDTLSVRDGGYAIQVLCEEGFTPATRAEQPQKTEAVTLPADSRFRRTR